MDMSSSYSHFFTRATIRSKGAFTLTEMLVVVAILSVVMALLLSAMPVVLEATYQARCLSNLRQLSAGCLAYGSDNDNLLVPICDTSQRTWRALISPYIGANPSVFKCPADPNAQRMNFDPTQGRKPTSYGINITGANGIPQLNDYMGINPGKKYVSVRNPSATIMICDIARVDNQSDPPSSWTTASVLRDSYGYARFSPFISGDSWNIYPRHGHRAKANVAYYDGHCEGVDLQRDIIDHSPNDPQCIYDNQ